MVTKVKRGDAAASSSADKRTASQLADTVKESASQIWLAGLGAFSKAQEEGGKVFETLVKEGLSIQRKTQAVAEDKLSEATSRMAGMATELSSKASGQWDKLESIFEARVSKAMARLGVPTAAEVQALIDRVEALQRSVDAMGGKTAAPRARKAAAKAAKPAPAKAARKTAARKAA